MMATGFIHLTDREQEVLDLLVGGYANWEIAERLLISEHTVRAHMRALMQKTATSNRTELACNELRKRMRELQIRIDDLERMVAP